MTKVLFRYSMVLLVVAVAFTACEDEPPTTYDPVPFLEAYLTVDKPVQGIIVAISQPITEPFDYGDMMISDAEVTLSAKGVDYELRYVERNGVGSYLLPDSSITVKPDTRYEITVRLPNGKSMYAETVTPQRIGWITPPREFLQYPQDTTRLFSPDSLRIEWTPGNSTEYIVRVRVLDTLGYGRYLDPPVVEKNERTNNIPFEEPDDPTFYTFTRWGFVQTSRAPTVWAAFRWFGLNEVAILAPDKPMLDWFKSTQWGGRSVVYRPEYSNVEGGVGIFASASIVRQNVFVLKNKKQ